jgi:3'-phosphoadenosine 5'-phosphosulfate (PAPS) 3'-phosphatase
VPDALPPIFLATAVESVIRAGEIQIAHVGGAMRVDKKGAIDLVTEIDLRIEREFRSAIAERFPKHVVLGEEFSIPSTAPPIVHTDCRSSVRLWHWRLKAYRRWLRSTIRTVASCSRPSAGRARG